MATIKATLQNLKYNGWSYYLREAHAPRMHDRWGA